MSAFVVQNFLKLALGEEWDAFWRQAWPLGGGREEGGGLAAEQIEQCIWQFAPGSREEEEAAEGLGVTYPTGNDS